MICDGNFYKIVSNPQHYLSHEFVPYTDSEFPDIPSAKLDDAIVHFTHYSSLEEGASIWKKRSKRINWDNLYIIAADMRLTEEQIREYGRVKCKKLVVFTSKKYPYPWCLYVKRFSGQEKWDLILIKL